jgi:hypothetical protein
MEDGQHMVFIAEHEAMERPMISYREDLLKFRSRDGIVSWTCIITRHVLT